VLVNARVAVIGVLPTLPVEPAVAGEGTLAPRGSRRIHLGRWIEAPVYDLDAVRADHEVKGPAIFEAATTTVLIREDERARATAHGWLDLRLG
jgi:N-methylhydantoinase A